jgi:uncharacterized protein YbjT (DUF2867 family)
MYVLLGSNGNITSKIAALLLRQGTPLRVVGRNARSLAGLKAAGAATVHGDIGDKEFLADAFDGATAVYTMIPTDYAANDLSAEQDRLGTAVAQALAAASVKHVVNLSSVGARLSSGTGPIAGLHRQEKRLDELTDVNVLHLRPGHFFENHLMAIDMIRASDIYADMYSPEARLPMVATSDIAEVVVRELRAPSGNGKRVLHLRAPNLYRMREVAATLGEAIGKPGLAYVQSSPQEGKAALLQLGFSASAAEQLAEMSEAFSSGRLDHEYDIGPIETTAVTLAQFAKTVFRPAFERA